ncbi:hypothetical protein, conserved [Babesia bigemina]|uniref:Uncharacterized protein n=1 Tax=Babesia bigemina TaxID=5866 RepID=A0A061DEX8_BABBI|nr:hypothetical protein, conserved [Babesia bigemina]CDR98055.1 hypothetical protein, conserved [Babesia bigemina]|eukprot:XP_012770241.1 hypothetical protein, conserved [Babesia bigemina]
MASCEPQPWLHEFRRCLKSLKNPEEYVSFALSYNPHEQLLRDPPVSAQGHDRRKRLESTTRKCRDGSMCSGIVTPSVTDVYNCGTSAFVRSRDVQLDLSKVYLLLSNAKDVSAKGYPSGYSGARLHNAVVSSTRSDSGESDDDGFNSSNIGDDHGKQTSLLDHVVRRFERYVVICMALAEQFPFEHASYQHSPDVDLAGSDKREKRLLRRSLTNFRINPGDYRNLRGVSDPVKEVETVTADLNVVTTLSWPFYRDATCDDIFKLLCYSLMRGNFQAFDIILQNSEPCILEHVKESWSVLLSYVPIVGDYRRCRDLLGTVFSISEQVSDEDCSKVIDWVLWRTYVILEVTKCSFHVALKFLKTMAVLLNKIQTTSAIVRSKLYLFRSLLSLMKQYIIYVSFKTGSVMTVKEIEASSCLSYLGFLQLKASERLQLFIECIEMPILGQESCVCEDRYRDKYGIYKVCLHCKTVNATNVMTVFFRLQCINEDISDVDNAFCGLSEEFGVFFAELKRCANTSSTECMEGLYQTFDGEISTDLFETLYALTNALLVSGHREVACNTVFRLLFDRSSRYNLLENYFVYKSIFSLFGITNDASDDGNAAVLAHEASRTANVGNSCLQRLSRDHTTACSYSRSEPADPDYLDFIRTRNSGDGKVTLALVLKAVRCQLNFMEAVLNLMSIMRMLPLNFSKLHIGIAELTEALCDQDRAASLIQKILVRIIDKRPSVDDFRMCIHALQDIAAHINGLSLQDLHMMFFFTICISSSEVGYLDAQIQVWFASSSKGIDKIGMFLMASLSAVKAVIYRLSGEQHVNFAMAKLVTELSHGLHEGAADWKYLKHPIYESAIKMHEMIQVYLDFLGIDWDGNLVNEGGSVLSFIESGDNVQYIPDYEIIISDIRRLGMFQRISTVATTTSLFSSNVQGKHKKLGYNLYNNKTELMEHALSSLAACYLESAEKASPDTETYWECRIFASILRGAYMDGGEGFVYGEGQMTKRLCQIRDDALLVLPAKARKDILAMLGLILNLVQESQSHGNAESSAVESAAMSVLMWRLLASSYVRSADFGGLAKLCAQFANDELPAFIRFLKENTFHIAPIQLDSASEASDLCASSITLFEVITGPDCDTESTQNAGNELVVNDFVLRNCILKLLGKVNLAKIEVCQPDKMKISFDKLAHRFTGNTASVLLSKALGKAETGLSSINLKKMQFETLKGKFFSSAKKSTDIFDGRFLPVLNFYNTAVLCITDYDFSDPAKVGDGKADDQDVIRWRSVVRFDVVQLLRVDVELGVMMMLEMCNFTMNILFIEQMHKIFHNINVHLCMRIIQVLRSRLSKLGWHQSLIAHLESIEGFLSLFLVFPGEVDIYIGRFIASSTYRADFFAQVAEYVLEDVNAFLQIYKCLDALFSCKEADRESSPSFNAPLGLGDLTNALWTNICLPEHHCRITDPLIVSEYVSILLQSLEKTFWASDPDDLLDKIRSIEPEFLNFGAQYRNCLLSMYDCYVQKRMHKPGNWLCWRKLVYRYLQVYPEEETFFGDLFRPASNEVLRLLEVVERTTDGFDITEVDDFDMFKRQLLRKVNVRNYFEIVNAMRHVDGEAAKVLLEFVRSDIHGAEYVTGFNAARALHSLDVETASRW